MFAPEYTQFINALGSFDYVSANKHLMRINKAHPAAGALCNRLSHCESQYTSLQFLKPKIFRRDDLQILHGSYCDIVAEVERELSIATSSISGNAAASSSATGGTSGMTGVGASGLGKDGTSSVTPSFSSAGTGPGAGISLSSGNTTIGRAAGARYSSTSPKITFDTNSTHRNPSSQQQPLQQQHASATDHPPQHQQQSHPVPHQGRQLAQSSGHHNRGLSISHLQHARERTSSSNIANMGGNNGSGGRSGEGGTHGGSNGSPGHHNNNIHGRYGSSHDSIPGEYLNRSPQAFRGYEHDELTTREYIALYTLIRELCGLRMATIEIYRLLASSTVEIDVLKILPEAEVARLMYDSASAELRSTVLGIGVQHEIEILRNGLLTDKAIVEYDLQRSAAHLHLAKTLLADWRKLVVEQEYAEKSYHRQEETSWRMSSFFSVVAGGASGSGLSDDKKKKKSSSSVSSIKGGVTGAGAGLVPNHMQWLGQWMTSEKSKMTLYFMETLLEKEQVVGGDERSLWAGMETDMHGMIRTFRKRAGVHSVSFVYEITPDVRFSRLGYLSASAPYTPPTGINSFPCIYSYPPDPPRDHWPNIISIIQGSSKILQMYRSQYFYDRKIGCTYYVARCDPHVSVVIIYLDKHPQPDSGAMEFLQMLAGKLRHTEALAALRME
ncbi:hypothetical protein BGW42_006618 [Actinomortierella wolfii]|nr:hypothetical protein BGW42_006618 [Actinomortierella wolfii]